MSEVSANSSPEEVAAWLQENGIPEEYTAAFIGEDFSEPAHAFLFALELASVIKFLFSLFRKFY